jgi:type IV secretion system protein VirB6
MLQSAMIAGGIRSAPASQAGTAAAGGAIQAGAGLPYSAGRSTGMAAAATGRAAANVASRAVSIARAGYQGARTAAYKLAALRGRSQ